MQTSVPDLIDLSKEPQSTFDLYGPDSRKPGTYAANCLLARRLAERDVRFVQLYHRGWDQHNDLPRDLALQCKGTDQASAALVMDLKQRGLLDDTLVVWGGEFGRTVYCQGKLTDTNYGRDHHPRCFTMWMAGGGIKRGFSYRRDRRLLLQRRREPGSRARSAGHDPALPGRRPPEADLQVPGPPLPPDGRARQRGERDSRVARDSSRARLHGISAALASAGFQPRSPALDSSRARRRGIQPPSPARDSAALASAGFSRSRRHGISAALAGAGFSRPRRRGLGMAGSAPHRSDLRHPMHAMRFISAYDRLCSCSWRRGPTIA